MLAYLDALIAALSERDPAEVARLLAHPLARILPDAAREEAMVIAADGCGVAMTPLRVLQLRRHTAELLRDVPLVADRAEASEGSHGLRTSRGNPPALARRPGRHMQMELPLSG